MRLRDLLVLFGPLLLVTVVGGIVLFATVQEATRRERDLENDLLLTAAHGHFARSLRLLVTDLARAQLDGRDEAEAIHAMEEHAFVHGFTVRGHLIDDGGPMPAPAGLHALRLWMPVEGDRRLVADVDLGHLISVAVEISDGRVQAILEKRVAGRAGSRATPPDALDVPLAPLVAPAQVVPTSARLVLRVRSMETAALLQPWPRRPDLLIVVVLALLVGAYTSVHAARQHIGRRRLLRQVEASRARFQDFTEIASDWYWELDPMFRFTGMFGRYEQFMGLTAADIVGRHYRDLLAAHAGPRSLQDPAWGPELTKALEERRRVSDLSLDWRRPDGAMRVFRINARPMYDHDGRFAGYRGTAVDQTALVEAQQAVAQARDLAEKALAFKTRFMAGVSHDLQQPLLSIGLFADQLLVPNRTEIVIDVARRIHRCAESASAMLMQLHELSRLEDAAMRPSITSVPLTPLLGALADEYGVLCDEKNLCLRVLCPADAVVRSDAMALERILRNLLSNAIRYTSTGAVLVTVRRRREHLLIQVWDTGRGIDAQDLPRIFEENWRGRPADDEPGLGLGLAVVQRAATLLGHPVQVASRPGRGSVFSLLVPKAAGVSVGLPSPAEPSSPPESGSARRSSGRCSEGATSP